MKKANEKNKSIKNDGKPKRPIITFSNSKRSNERFIGTLYASLGTLAVFVILFFLYVFLG